MMVAFVVIAIPLAILIRQWVTQDAELGVPGAETAVTVPFPTLFADGPTSAPSDGPRPTINEFLPVDRGLGECISAIPKPGCGSEARGGWHQGLVLLAILVGLALIGWRIVASSRKARQDQLSRS